MPTLAEGRSVSTVEASIERQFADTCRRIRLIDVGTYLLAIAALLCAYAIAFSLFDLATDGAGGWPAAVRWIGFFAFVGLAGVLGWRAVLRLTRRVNPYFAAQRLEETVPDAKNSLINWLDLRDEDIPAAFRKNVGGKAAHDLDEADPEEALDRRPVWIALAVFGVLFVGLVVLFAARPGQFMSLMRRAFLPFYQSQLLRETRITLLRPDGGDAVVTEKQAVNFVADIDGRVPEVNQPGAPALQYRYQAGDKFVAVPMQKDDNGNWATRLLPDQLGSTGVWYKITAGSAETPVYQVSVRAQPFVQRYEVTYKYRPYLGLRPETIEFPNEQAALPFVKRHRGTEVALVVHTNRTLRQAGARLTSGKGEKHLVPQVLRENPQAFRIQWTLEQSGDLFVSFTSIDGETYASRIPIPVQVLSDQAPTVAITRPAQNVALPANGTLEVEGTAEDDVGLKDVSLRLELVEGKGVPLRAQPYRPDGLDLDGNGMYPVHLDYLDLIKLDELRTPAGEPIKLAPGMIVRYWLEATDNSDYPNATGNVGKSQAYEIKIQPPQDEEKQQQARDAAQKKQKAHKDQQDQKLAKEKQQRQAAAEQKQDDSQRAEKAGEQLHDELNKLDQPSSSDKGQAKGQEPNPGESKQGGDGGGNGNGPQPESKDQQPPEPKQAGDSKGAPQQGGADSKPGESKDAGQPKDGPPKDGPPKDGKTGDSGGSQPQSDPSKGSQKEGGGDKSGQADSKGEGEKGAGQEASPGKAGNPDSKKGGNDSQSKGAPTGQNAPSAQSKPGGDAPKAPPQDKGPPQGVAKGDEANGPQSLSKEQGPATDKQSTDPRLKAEAEKNPGQPIGTGKAAGNPPSGKSPQEAPGFTKDSGSSAEEGKPRTPTPEDVEHLKDLMQRKDSIGDLAAKALEMMSKEAPDPKVREQAKEALNQSGRNAAPNEDPSNPKASSAASNPKDGSRGDPAQANPKEGTPPPKGDGAKAGKPGSAEVASDNPNGSPNAKASPPTGGGPDDLKGDPARKDLSRFGGNLQIEDFIKRATPEYRAKHGISDAEWQQFLAHASEYDALLRKLQQPKSKAPTQNRGSLGSLGTSGPSAVQTQQRAVAPADSGRAQPPPELRDAVDRLRGSNSAVPR
jgi:hypothetical protein